MTEDPLPDGGSDASDPDASGGDGGSDADGGSQADAGGSDSGAEEGGRISRRTLLKAGGVAALGAVGTGFLGWRYLFDDDAAPGDWEADGVDRTLVERYAPRLEFGVNERWYPTDPRRYLDGGESGSGGDEGSGGESGSGGDEGVTLDGFAALDGYTREFRESGEPPAPTVFYRTLSEASSPLVVLQYWMYSAFDQFAVNFHWHDWELLQVFVDTDADEVVLLSASAHSRKVPNNEHVDPEGGITVLSEVGAHASALDVDGSRTFRRTSGEDLAADVTNGAVDVAERIARFPFAYGLPRDERGRIPYSAPELDGDPLWEHPDLPNVRAEDLIGEPLVVRDEANLATAPTEVPAREPGATFVVEGSADADDADHTYALEPIEEVANAISDFGGPQLSFEFTIPGAVEDQFADHLTSVGIPWNGERYVEPLSDVSDDTHRRRVADEYGLSTGDDGDDPATTGDDGDDPATTGDDGNDSATTAGTAAAGLGGSGVTGGALDLGADDQAASSGGSKLVAAVEATRSDTEGRLRGAPDEARSELAPEVGFTLTDPPVEAGCLLETPEGETVSTVTAGGALLLDDVEEGENRLVVDGAGQAPYAERVPVEGSGEVARPGAEGSVPLVPREDAVKVAVGEGSAGVDRVRVEDDYAGTLYDAPAPEAGDAVYVHREGTYTVDLRDREGDPGAARVDPDGERVELSSETGKAPMAEYLARYLRESAELTREYQEGGDDGDDGDGDDDATTSPGQGGTPTDEPGGTSGGGNGTTRSVAQFFEAAADAADRAAEAARDGNLQSADARLGSVRERLNGVRSRVEAQRGRRLSETLATVLDDRADGADRRAAAAIESSK
ncbi:hypothetical protein BRD00_10840 [Halobacteriales archaeon QS_8_69_26]|nr:MAG: hypothetical protein BRD00_10840 [Halobacteriales archaeon QS_8_69_26]